MGCCLSSQMNPENLFSIKTFDDNVNENVDKNVECDSKLKDPNESSTGQIRRDSGSIDAVLDQPEESKNSIAISRKRKKSLSLSDDSSNECKRKTVNSDYKSENSNLTEGDRSIKVEVIETPPKSENSNLTEGDRLIKVEVIETPRKSRKRKLSENDSETTQNDTEADNKVVKLNSENENNATDESIDKNIECVDHDSKIKDCNGSDTGETARDCGSIIQDENTRASEVICDESECKEEELDVTNDEERRNKSRKRRKKNKKNKIGDNSHGLQILSKAQWKSLRNKYLNEQRKKMNEFKQYVHKYKQVHNSNKTENIKTEENNGDCSQKGDVKETITVSSRLTLSPGSIVKVTLNEPVISKSSFESEAKIFPEIKYVDIANGSNVVYVRFATSSAAEDCVKSGHWVNAEVIKGKEEQSYWDKILVEREEKLSKGRSTRKGRDKLLKKAEEMHMKHIWFD